MTAPEANEMVRLAIETVQESKKLSILLDGDPNWFAVLTLEHYGDSSESSLFIARVKIPSGGYSRLVARKDKIIALQIV